MNNPWADTLKRFRLESRDHEMKVLLNKELYRHVRFMNPKDSSYWFELVTTPGQLTFMGDGASFVFRRDQDMFGFFRMKNLEHVSVDYIAEKCTSVLHRRDDLKAFDEDAFRKVLGEYVGYALDGTIPEEQADEFRAAIQEDIFDTYDTSDQHEAYRAVQEFEFRYGPKDKYNRPTETFQFEDAYEWFSASREYDWWFVWACHAIVWGVGEFDRTMGIGPAVDVAKEGILVG